MNVGFTGTRKGMSRAQKHQLVDVLRWLSEVPGRDEFHHGDAEGADRQAATIVGLFGFSEHLTTFRITKHPAGHDPLKRNREIVAVSDIIVAAPYTDKEELRSGTWYTVRYAREAQKPVIFLSR